MAWKAKVLGTVVAVEFVSGDGHAVTKDYRFDHAVSADNIRYAVEAELDVLNAHAQKAAVKSNLKLGVKR